jgi:AcrR family transcriptional regulator
MSEAKVLRPGRKAQAEATRGRLLQAAIAAFTARPYDEVAVGDIADAAGTAHGLPFHYFGNKRGLYLEAMREAAQQLARAHTVSGHGAPRARLKAMLLAHFGFMRAHPALAGALLHGGIGANPEA